MVVYGFARFYTILEALVRFNVDPTRPGWWARPSLSFSKHPPPLSLLPAIPEHSLWAYSCAPTTEWVSVASPLSCWWWLPSYHPRLIPLREPAASRTCVSGWSGKEYCS